MCWKSVDDTERIRVMRILVWSDLHAHAWYDSERPGMWREFTRLLGTVRALVAEQKIDHVVFCGDLFEAKRTIRMDVAVSTVYALNNCGLHSDMSHVHYVAGNHDRYYEDACALDLLRYPGGPNVYSESYERLNVQDVAGNSYTLAFLPHGVNALPDLEKQSDYDVLFMHHDCIGGSVAQNIKTQVEAPVLAALLCKTGKRKLVVNGHYHVPQKINTPIPVECVGAPVSLTWADLEEPGTDRPRGCLILDVQDGCVDITRVPLWQNFARFFREGDPRIRTQMLPKDHVLVDTTNVVRAAVTPMLATHQDGGAQSLSASVAKYVESKLETDAERLQRSRFVSAGMQYTVQPEAQDDLLVDDDDDLLV